MQVYTEAKLLPVARQLFGEFKYALGTPPQYDLIKTFAIGIAGAWTPKTYRSFAESFPGQDPELARQAGQYLLDHFDDLWIENSEVKIPGEVKRRFGFEE